MSSVFLVEVRGLGDRDEIRDTIAVCSSLENAIAVCLDPDTPELTDEIDFNLVILEAQIDSPILATSIKAIQTRDSGQQPPLIGVPM